MWLSMAASVAAAAAKASHPGFPLMLGAQSLSAGGEFFGQRHSRIVHKGSVLRQLASTTIYSALQAIFVLGLLELVLPNI